MPRKKDTTKKPGSKTPGVSYSEKERILYYVRSRCCRGKVHEEGAMVKRYVCQECGCECGLVEEY